MNIKKIAALALSLVLILSLGACGGGSGLKTYDMGGGFSIDMDSGMEESTVEGYTYFYHSNTCAALVLKEDFSMFTAAGVDLTTFSLEDYADMVCLANDLDGSFKKDSNGNLVTTYSMDVNGQEFYYYVTVREGSDAYWLINFYCMNSQQDKYAPKFESWNNSIKVP